MDSGEEKFYRVELKTRTLYPGMILKADAFAPNGEKVILAGNPLTKEQIDELIAQCVEYIFYEKQQVVNERVIPLDVLANAFNLLQELWDAANRKVALPEQQVEEVVTELVESISSASGNTVLNLMEMKAHDEYLYTHAINTAIVAIAFSKVLGYKKKGSKIIGIGALLHNVGYLFIPTELIEKTERLSDEELTLFQKAPVYGYELVKSQTGFGPLVQKIVLLHNERYDGTGYPLGLRGQNIGQISQIVSIASLYDLFTSGAPHRTRIMPIWQALEQIERLAWSMFNPQLVEVFVNQMPPFLSGKPFFYYGAYVRLNTGELGEIVSLPEPYSVTPTVYIYIDPQGKDMSPVPIHLKFDKTRFIEEIISDDSMIEMISKTKQRLGLDKTRISMHFDGQENMEVKKLETDAKMRVKANFLKIDLDLMEEDETSLK